MYISCPDDGCVTFQEYLSSHVGMNPAIAKGLYHEYNHGSDNCLNDQDVDALFASIDKDG